MTHANTDENAQANQPEHDANVEIAEGLAEQDPLSPEMYPEYESEDSSEHEAQIAALQSELDQVKDQMIRAVAEAENTRRRAVKERENASKYAVSAFAKDVLDVSDNLRRALDATPDELLEADPRVKTLMDGIEATERTLLRSFEKHGIEKIEPLDQPFDPNFHEVMFEAPVPGKPGGLVMQVVEPGYVLNGRILRPARVGVTKDDGSAVGGGQNGGHDSTPPGGTIDIGA